MSKNQAENIILEYLIKENRPFSAQDIANNLNGQLGKTAISSTLEKLASENKIIEKVYGKQKAYMALQNIDTNNIKPKLRDLDEKIKISEADLNRLKSENIRLETQVKAFGDKMSINELQSRISDIKAEINDLNDRFDKLKSANVKIVTKEERNMAQKELEKYAKEWRKLKRIGKEMMDAILDNCNLSKKDLCEDLGLILDEHENVQPPPI